jgi:hypothetical protein
MSGGGEREGAEKERRRRKGKKVRRTEISHSRKKRSFLDR